MSVSQDPIADSGQGCRNKRVQLLKGGDGDERNWANDVTASCMYCVRSGCRRVAESELQVQELFRIVW